MGGAFSVLSWCRVSNFLSAAAAELGRVVAPIYIDGAAIISQKRSPIASYAIADCFLRDRRLPIASYGKQFADCRLLLTANSSGNRTFRRGLGK